MSASIAPAAPSSSATPERHVRYLIIATLVSVLAGYLFGYDNLVISGATEFLQKHFDLDDAGKGWAASCAVIGCIVGTALAGWVVDRLGAKIGLWLCAVCFGASSIGTYFATSMPQYSAWRILGGLGIGAASVVAPMYIAEIAPTRIRGRLVTLYQFGIVLGILSAVTVNMFIQQMGDEAWNVSTGWRWMFMAGVAPAVLFGVMIMMAVESPRWLMKMGRRGEATKILSQLHGPQVAVVESREIEASLGQEEGKLSELFTTGFRKALIIGVMLAGLSQASGIFAILTYLPEFLKAAGAKTDDAFFQTVLVGVTLAIFTLTSLALVDVLGRKTLLIMGTLAQTLSLVGIAWMYHSQYGGSGVLALVMVFVAAHALGNGAVCWVVISEIFPNKIRGRAMSIATNSLWIVAFLGNLILPSMRTRFDLDGDFLCFSVAALINLLYVIIAVPETKGRSLEEIESLWITPAK